MTNDYRDILHLPHPEPKTAPRMPVEARAAQFAPFAALTGYDDAVEETARYTETMPELTEEMQAKIGETLLRLQNERENQPSVYLAYFAPDCKKEGGAIVTATGTVQKLDPQRRMLRLSDGTAVPFSMILQLQQLS